MLILALAAIALVLLIFLKLRSQRKKAGIRGWVLDQDLDGKGRRIYRDSSLGISCKPDVVERNRIIEYKSATVKDKIRRGDLLQVAAQMLITGSPEAELRYANKWFTLLRDSAMMRSAMNTARKIINKMRWHLTSRNAPRGTPSTKRCVACVFGTECAESIRR